MTTAAEIIIAVEDRETPDPHFVTDRARAVARLVAELRGARQLHEDASGDGRTAAQVVNDVEDRERPDPRFTTDRARAVRRLAAELRGELPLEEAVETIVGNLCRATDGQFAACDVGSEKFGKWFGASKVVDSAGEPLRVFHGTTFDFDAFKLGIRPPAASWAGPSTKVWFAADSSMASVYAAGDYFGKPVVGGRVLPLYASLQNPKTFPNDSDGLYAWTNLSDDAVDEHGERYDGVLFLNPDGSVHHGYATDPRQLKSALSNTGEFDPEDPRLREAFEQLTGDLCRAEDGRYVNCGTGKEVGPTFVRDERERDSGEKLAAYREKNPPPLNDPDPGAYEQWKVGFLSAMWDERDRGLSAHFAQSIKQERDRLARGMVERGFTFSHLSDLSGGRDPSRQNFDGLAWRHEASGIIVETPIPVPRVRAHVIDPQIVGLVDVDPDPVVTLLSDPRDPNAALPITYSDSRVDPPTSEAEPGSKWYSVDRIFKDVDKLEDWSRLSGGNLQRVVYRFAPSPNDPYWQKAHSDPDHKAAASANPMTGTITFYGGQNGNGDGGFNLAEHELGHLLTLGHNAVGAPQDFFGGDGIFGLIPGVQYTRRETYREMFDQAAAARFGLQSSSKDRERFGSFVTGYGSMNADEDMAEMYRVGVAPIGSFLYRPGATAKDAPEHVDFSVKGLDTPLTWQDTKLDALLWSEVLKATPDAPANWHENPGASRYAPNSVPGHLWMRVLLLNDIAPRRLADLDRLDAHGTLAPLQFRDQSSPWTYREIRDRLAEYKTGVRDRFGKRRPVDEALETIVGNLCREEDGQFASCGAGADDGRTLEVKTIDRTGFTSVETTRRLPIVYRGRELVVVDRAEMGGKPSNRWSLTFSGDWSYRGSPVKGMALLAGYPKAKMIAAAKHLEAAFPGDAVRDVAALMRKGTDFLHGTKS